MVNVAHLEGGSLAVNPEDDLLNMETERFFNKGMPSYYLHIAQLYEEKQAYSFVAEFAYTGLIFINHYQGEVCMLFVHPWPHLEDFLTRK